MPRHITTHSRKNFKVARKRIFAISFACIFAVIGVYLLASSRAAPNDGVLIEPEQGTKSGSVTVATDTSSGQYVRFDTASSVKPTIVGNTLQLGNTGQTLRMRGVCVWGLQDMPSKPFETEQYANRQKIVNNIKSWGANEIRFQLNSQVYYNQSAAMKAQHMQHMKEWRDLVTAAGMYFHLSWWDAHNKKADWGTKYAETFPMMTDAFHTLGNDPMVIYEPFNEPNGPSDAQWLTAYRATLDHFRTNLGYNGILIINMLAWSHAYHDGNMTQLEQYDASLRGMNGKHQLIFAKHDYANEGYANPNSGFDSAHWARNTITGTTWDFKKHLVWETEFGNQNGSANTVYPAWSAGMASWMADKVNDGTLVGATAFLYGPWLDGNAMTQADSVTPNQWGSAVKNNFLGRVK